MKPRFIPFAYTKVEGEEVATRARRFYELMHGRRTVRDFSSAPVPVSVIADLVRTASTAPSGAHRQPWTFVAVPDPQVKRQIRIAAEKEERDGRSNTGQPSIPPTGYGFNPGARRGIRIGNARDGSVTAFIPDPCPYPYAGVPTMADGIMADAEGNVYGGDFLGTVRKFVKR